MFWVYILHSQERDRFYIGQCSALETRMAAHLNGQTKSTHGVSDWEVVFLQRSESRSEAMRLEQRIKKTKSRKSISRYIRDPRNLIGEPTPL